MDIIPIIVESGYRFNNRFIKILNGITHVCKQNHYKFQFFDISGLPNPEINLAPILIVGASTKWTRNTTETLCQMNYHPIVIGFEFEDSFSTFITQNHLQDAYTLTHMLCSKKRRKCAFVGYNEQSFGDIFKLTGFKKAIFETNTPFFDNDIYLGSVSPSIAISDFLNHSEKYDTVFCSNDTIAILLISTLPCQPTFDIVSLGDLHLKHFSTIPLHSISPDYYSMGKIAVEYYSMILRYKAMSKSIIYVSSSFDYINNLPSSYLMNSDYDKLSHNQLTSNDKIVDLLNIAIERCDETDLKILNLVLKDITYEEISYKLFMSVTAIKKRLNKLFLQLNISSKKELVALLKLHKLDFSPSIISQITIN